MVDGIPAAMWGVRGTLLGDTAMVWVVMSEAVKSLPMSLMRETRKVMGDITSRYRVVHATVLPNDEAAIRFALYLGFHAGDGSHQERAVKLLADPEKRIPIGDGYVIELCYGEA